MDPELGTHSSVVEMFRADQMLWLKNAITRLSGWMDDPRILGTSELRVAEGKREVMDMVTSNSLNLYPSLISVLGILFL